MNISQFKRPKRRSLTADQLVRKLESDPQWVAEREQLEAERMRRVHENLQAAAPMKAELARAGFAVDLISDLYFNFRIEHFPIILILLKWLPRIDNVDVKEAIIRALTDKLARPIAAQPFIDEFHAAPITDVPRRSHYKASIANALSVVADDSYFDQIVDLIRDRRHGWSRSPLAIALQRMKRAEAIDVLMKVLDEDPDLNDPAPALIVMSIRALGNRKAFKARNKIERFLNHSSDIVRKEAQRSLDKLDRAEQKAQQKRRASANRPRSVPRG